MADEVMEKTGRFVNRPALVVEIEAGDDRNSQVLFAPKQETLRGRFSPHNFAGDASSLRGIMNMPAIPGVRVRLDFRAGTGLIHDPLSQPQHQATLEKASAIWKKVNPMEAAGRDIVARPEMLEEEMDDNRVATWMYWMMRMVGGGLARVVSGDMPQCGNETEIRAAISKLLPKAKIDKRTYDSIDTREART